jgi:hypothetical protein
MLSFFLSTPGAIRKQASSPLPIENYSNLTKIDKIPEVEGLG